MSLITNLENKDLAAASKAKLALVSQGSQLIPKGIVNFAELKNRALIQNVAAEIGVPEAQTLIMLLIKNFCESINVVRNMSEDQAIECAVYLYDCCVDFTIEDYVIMFTLAKRGQLGAILDHIDIEVIADMHHEYLKQRNRAFKAIREDEQKAERARRLIEFQQQTPEQISASDAAIESMKQFTRQFAEKDKTDYWERRRKQVAEDEAKLKNVIQAVHKSGDGELIESVKVVEQENIIPPPQNTAA